MVNTPESHKKIIIDHDFRNKYPPGSTLALRVEGRRTVFVCTIDSYIVEFDEKISVWVTLVDPHTEKEKQVLLSMDSHGAIGVYNQDRIKNAIVRDIRLPEVEWAHSTVKKHGDKVHSVVQWARQREEFA